LRRWLSINPIIFSPLEFLHIQAHNWVQAEAVDVVAGEDHQGGGEGGAARQHL